MAAIPAELRSARDKTRRDPEPARSVWLVLYERFGAHLGFGGSALLAAIGWASRDAHLFTAKAGIGYLLGYVAIGCMLALLMYPLRKRLTFLAFLGPTKNWF